MEFAFPALRETAVIGSGLMTPASATARPQESFFYAQVRPNQPLRPIFHPARGIREYSFFRRRSNPSAWPCGPRDGFEPQGVETEWQEKEGYMWNPFREGEGCLRSLYPDMPPETLLIQHLGINNSVKGGELQRAKWFWHRRPKKLILARNRAVWVALLCLSLWAVSVISPRSMVVIRGIGWLALAAIAVAVFVDICRYAQWKLEYYSAISRLIVAVTW